MDRLYLTARTVIITNYLGSKFIDGSIASDLPMKRISELFNVNSFIVSQTNPLAIPFMDQEEGGGNINSKNVSFWKICKNLIASEIKLRISQVFYILI